MVQSTKTFRVFVSSTFSDLVEERNALQKNVFPKLRKLCMEHGFRFQAIDLRWGVSEEAGLDQKTMKICLDEIERSQKVSPKPNFIVLLGDRYGWQPLPYEIPADEFEEIKSVIHDENDRKFLLWEGDVLKKDQLKKREGWYCRDENAIPPVYCLKPRLVDYEDDASDDEIKKARNLEYEDWETIEKRLKSILLNVINDLSWDKEDPRRFKYESSATEQEIINGVLNLPEDGSLSEKHVFSFIRKIKNKNDISFDDNSKDFLDYNENNEWDEFAEENLSELKAKIEDKLPSSNIFDYETEWKGNGVNKKHIEKLCDDVFTSLEKVIMDQINAFEDKDPLEIEIEAHKEFGKERCKFFIGREDNLAQIKNYLENPNPKPLIVYGESGSGKSALMAKAVENSYLDYYENPTSKVIVRFIGATPESSDLRSLLESLSRQITKIYNEDNSNIPTEYNKLVQDFKERLKFATAEKPLYIFLDALDQLYDSDNAHNLTWISDELPENVHIVISTLKNIFQSSLEPWIYVENTVEVLPLEKNEGRAILDAWFQDFKRKLTDKQGTEIINNFKVEGLPLYLKLAFEESKIWKSYTPVPELESGIKWMINSLFKRLSRPENHGEMLVSRSLGFLSAAKNGLTEDEMLDILALDDDVFCLTKKFHEPTEDKLPVALWSRLYFDLEPYLTERSADNTSLLAFYHRQLGEVARAKYHDNIVKKSRHQLITKYFYEQDLYFEKDEAKVYNIRKISELPYQETNGECWKNLKNTLCDLRFVEAKCAVGRTYELIKDYNFALEKHPDSQEENKKELKHQKRIDKYVKDLIAYSGGKIEHLDIIPSVKPWTNKEIKKDIERINQNPTQLDYIRIFSIFVKNNSHKFAKFGSFNNFCLQEAYNYADSGPVSENSRKIIDEHDLVVIILKDNWRYKFNPHTFLINSLEDNYVIKSLDITANGKTAITANIKMILYIWDLKTGCPIKQLIGHSKSLSTDNIKVAIKPDGKNAVTVTDYEICIWNLETGENLKKIEFNFINDDGLINHFEITPDGKTAITSASSNVRIWNLENNKNSLIAHNLPLKGVKITADGKKMISGTIDGILRVWDIQNKKQIKILNTNRDLATFTITPDGKTAITGSKDDLWRLWDLEKCKLLKKLMIKKVGIRNPRNHNKVVITPDGKTAITCMDDVNFWDVENVRIIKKIEHTGDVNDLAVSVDGKYAATCVDSNVFLWDIETGKSQKIFINDGNSKKVINTPDREKIISGIGESYVITTPDREKIISKSGDRLIVWDQETGKQEILEGHEFLIKDIVSTLDGKKVLSTGNGIEPIRVWDIINCIQIDTIGPASYSDCLIITPDGKNVISKTTNTVYLWTIETGIELKKITLTNKIMTFNINPDGKTLVLSHYKSINSQSLRPESVFIEVWDLETGQTLKKIHFKGDINKTIYTPDGNNIVLESDGTVFVLNIETCQIITTIKTGPLSKIEVTPDGKTLITQIPSHIMFDNRNLHFNLWSLETGNLIKTFKTRSRSEILKVTPDGKYIVSGGNDGTVCIWNIENGNLMSLYKAQTSVDSLKVGIDGNLIFGTHLGDLFSANIMNLQFGPPITTPKRIWLYGNKEDSGHWDVDIKADCQWCGNRFTVSDVIIYNISELEKKYKKTNGWISDEAWGDIRLISECSECHQKIRFNPFIVDNSKKEIEKEKDYQDPLQKRFEIQFDDPNKSESNNNDIKKNNEKKKSRWKFWK